MTNLVQGHEEIHIYVDHLVDELEELEVEDIKPLEVSQPSEEPSVELLGAKVRNDQVLDVVDLKVVEVNDSIDYNDHASYYEDKVDSEGDVSDHYYDQATYEDDYNYSFDFYDNDDWHGQNNEDYRHDSGKFVGHDNEEYDNDNHDDPIEVDVEQFYYRIAGKEPVIKEQHEDPVDEAVEDSTNIGGSDLEEEPDLHPNGRSFDDNSSDSWDNKEDVHDESVQMGAGIMNSYYESEELHSLNESSSNTTQSEDDSDDDHPATDDVDNSIKRRKFPSFKSVAKTEHIRFEKDMLFTLPNQFKDAITDYANNGGWGVWFVKNNLQRVRARC